MVDKMTVNVKTMLVNSGGGGLFDLILFIPSTIFQLNRDGSSWV